jgi:hypothetical protein
LPFIFPAKLLLIKVKKYWPKFSLAKTPLHPTISENTSTSHYL